MRRLFRLPGRDRRQLRDDIDEELHSLVDARIESLVALGMSAEEARVEAHRRLGGSFDDVSTRLQQSAHLREQRMQTRERLDNLIFDLVYALRRLRQAPGFTFVAILTLALGIGATTAIFSVVYSVMLRPLPYAHSDRLVNLRERNGPEDGNGMFVTYGNFGTWTRETHAFEALAGYRGGPANTLTGAGGPLALRVLHASASYWRALYIAPSLGRYFSESEDRPGAPHVVVLSYDLWRSCFSADSAVLGKVAMLSGVPYTIIGVAPREYDLFAQASQSLMAWVPLALDSKDLAQHADHELTVVGLVREGFSAEAAIGELTRVETRLAKEYPNSFFDGGIIATPMRDSIVGRVRPVLLLLIGAVSFVLLIACANISNLLLARAAARQKEIAIRCALGAARGRIVAQLLAESTVLALAGGVAGLGLAAIGIRALLRTAPRGVPRLHDVALNLPVLVFTFALCIVCGVAFGLVPALRAARADVREALTQGGRAAGGAVRYGLRASLVVGQLAIALTLLVAAGLLLRSAIRVQRVSPGFDPRDVLVGNIALPPARFRSDTVVTSTYGQFLQSVITLPGVRSAGLVSQIPIGTFGRDCPTVRPEGSVPKDERNVVANVRIATPGFFATARVTLERGRLLAEGDRAGAPLVVVINRTLAHRLYGDGDAVGRRLAWCDGKSTATATNWYTIVGVIGDMRANGLMEMPPSEMYFPFAQSPDREMTLVVRGAPPVTALTSSLRRALTRADAALPLSGVATMEEIIARSTSVTTFTTTLLAILGAAGLVLAVVGVYGVIAYFVSQRTRELGVRLALGASSASVVGMVVRQGLALAATGVLAGLALSWMLARVMRSVLDELLYEVSPHDPATFLGIAALLIVVALLASAVPAWRAARLDPTVTLRAP